SELAAPALAAHDPAQTHTAARSGEIIQAFEMALSEGLLLWRERDLGFAQIDVDPCERGYVGGYEQRGEVGRRAAHMRARSARGAARQGGVDIIEVLALIDGGVAVLRELIG